VARFLRALRSAVLVESRHGRAAEIAGWSNAASAVAVALLGAAVAWSAMGANAAWLGLGLGALTIMLLRVALTHRVTVWVAAVLGTVTVAALGGSLAWLFAHVIEIPALPPVFAVLGGLVAALAPAASYAQLARRRAESVRDSLIDPISVPYSR
jgi:hypothetical protein